MGTTWSMEAVLSTWEILLHSVPPDSLDHQVFAALLEAAGDPGDGTPEEVLEILDALEMLLDVESAGGITAAA